MWASSPTAPPAAHAVLRSFLEEATGAPPPPSLGDAAALRDYLAGIDRSIETARGDVLQAISGQQSDIDGMLVHAEDVRDELHSL
eukprot:104295-Prymnesium_polylepis.1